MCLALVGLYACSSSNGEPAPEPDKPTSAEVIEDYIFREYCIENFDIDKDGAFSKDEIAKIKQIDISKIENIKNLKGIELFTELRRLICVENYSLEPFDITKNTKLTYLQCETASQKIKSIDLSKNIALDSVLMGGYFETIDVTNNKNLVYLYTNNTDIRELDVSNNLELKHLFCSNNSVGSLDVTKNVKLETLVCMNNYIVSIDLSKNINLEALTCTHGAFGQLIDISNNKKLNRITCISNPNLKYLMVWIGFDRDKLESFMVSDDIKIIEVE